MEPGHERVGAAEVPGALEGGEGQAEERSEPGRETARTIGGAIDGDEQRPELSRFVRLKEPVLLVERV